MQVEGATGPPAPMRPKPPLERLPWDIAQTEFGVQGSDFLGLLGGLLIRVAQTQRPPQVPDTS